MKDTFYQETTYAGFWLRAAAIIIDGFILGVLAYALIAIIGLLGFGAFAASSGISEESMGSSEIDPGFIAAILALYFGFMVIYTVGGWLYFALMESSAYQATLGKRVVGIVVTDLNGNRITFLQATGRFFGKIVSSLIFYIGYIMAGFTEKKQALHDMMASTLVLKDE